MADDKVRVLQIGPAGEKGVRFANIVNDLKHFNGRGGLGAVMGAKNLRAIAVRGTAKPDFADPAKLVAIARAGAEKVAKDGGWKTFKALGTLQTVTDNQLIGGLPTRNWTMGTFEHYEEIGAEAFAETMMDKPGTCFACAQSCRRDTKEGIEKPWRIEARYGGPEYETAGMVGANCMVGDLAAVVKANEIASRYGVDTISLGGVVGFVMECFERGLLTQEQIGFPAPFGDGEALVKLAEMIAERRGAGRCAGRGGRPFRKAARPVGGTHRRDGEGQGVPGAYPHVKGHHGPHLCGERLWAGPHVQRTRNFIRQWPD